MVGRELKDTVRVPDGDTVGVSKAVVGKGVREMVKLPEGDPVEV